MPELVHRTLDQVAEVELDSPPLNLVTAELVTQLRAVLHEIASTETIRVLILSGAGDRAFCAGSDLQEVRAAGAEIARRKLLFEKLVYRQLARMPIPTIAAIERPALGGGLELALCCDIRIAGANARFGMPEVGLGAIPGSGGTQRLPRIIGPARAKELILSGEQIDADVADRIGLVNRVVRPGGALEAARALALVIAQRGALAVREAKRLIDAASELDLDAGLAAELDASERVAATEDAAEGVRAFFEKRPPNFVGR